MRSPFQFDVIKDRGALGRVVDDGQVENVYRLQVMNRTEWPQAYRVTAYGLPGLVLDALPLSVAPADVGSVVVSLRLPPQTAQALQGQSVPVVFGIRSTEAGEAAMQREKSTFFVPR